MSGCLLGDILIWAELDVLLSTSELNNFAAGKPARNGI
jgi:hypothetical protein